MNEDERFERACSVQAKIDEWNEICVNALTAAHAIRNEAIIDGDLTLKERATADVKFWRSMVI